MTWVAFGVGVFIGVFVASFTYGLLEAIGHEEEDWE